MLGVLLLTLLITVLIFHVFLDNGWDGSAKGVSCLRVHYPKSSRNLRDKFYFRFYAVLPLPSFSVDASLMVPSHCAWQLILGMREFYLFCTPIMDSSLFQVFELSQSS